MLQKQLRDNDHLFTEDKQNYQKHFEEIKDLKSKLNEVTEELDQYKMLSKNNPLNNKIDIDKELQKSEQIHRNKLQSAHQQIDEWKHKCRDQEQACNSLKKQVRILENNLSKKESNTSTKIMDESVSEITLKIQDLFDISPDDDLLNELEKIKEEITAVELLKEELEKAQKMYKKLEDKHQKFLSKRSQSDMNEYSQGLINSKNEEIDNLNAELMNFKQRLDEMENIRWDLNHEKHDLSSKVNELQRIVKDRELEITRTRKLKEEIEASNNDFKETAKELIREKKELERKLKETEKTDDLEKSKTTKDHDLLKKETNSLVAYILSLEFAYDEEFDKLFKNQSYASEFDQARKHLENQKDIVGSLIERLQKDQKSNSKEVDEYKQYISELESKIEDAETHKNEAVKWKQSYDRLAITLKNTQGPDAQEMDTLLQDYEKLQNQLADLKLQNTQFGKELKAKEDETEALHHEINQNNLKIIELNKEIQDLRNESLSESHIVNTQNSNLILKLEKENKRLEYENDNLVEQAEKHEKITADINEKYQTVLEKVVQFDQAQKAMAKLDQENKSLHDQLNVMKKVNAEQKRSLINEPAEVMSAMNSLKATLNKRENTIKELKTEIQILQNLLDEARLEIKNCDDQSEQSEKATFADCLDILDSIITKPLGISSSNKSHEFTAILKRAQLIKEQSEEPIVHKILSSIKNHFPVDISEKENSCKRLNDFKQVALEALADLREQKRVTFDETNEMLDISTDSKNMRKPYGYKDAYIDISFVFDTFSDTFRLLKETEKQEEVEQITKDLKTDHENSISAITNDFYEKFEADRKKLVEQFHAEKESEFKLREQKIFKEYETKRVKMFEQFEKLKQDFQDQFTEQSKKYQDISEEEINRQKQEVEKQKEMYEKEYEERVQRKTNALEGMFNTRKNELEDQYNLKMQTLEFEMKTEVETQDHKNKTELEALVAKHQAQAEEKIKRIQQESDMKVEECEEKVKQKNEEVKKLKAEHEKKLKDHKKTMERELKFKSETLDRDTKIKIDREVKKYKEQIEDCEVKIKDLEDKLIKEKKKQKELTKSVQEKHRAEIKNLKNTHENELVRRKIEQEKEVKKAKRDLEIELDNIKKEHEVELMDKLLQQKKDLNASHNQKLKVEKAKYEKEIIEKETEINKKHNEAEIEILKKHEEEIQNLKQILTEKHEKVMNSAVQNVKAEYKDQ